ncbi:MAG TPA: glycerophosphodiester phosphodiesterase, partial [Acidimicrobiales bacterium]
MAAAREVGADGVEIDVWQTTDKSLVVNHDRYFGRHDVTRCSSAQLEATTLISTLAEVLEAAGELRINVEIKSTRSAPYNMAVAREVSAFLDASRVSHRCLVSSFSLAICDEV